MKFLTLDCFTVYSALSDEEIDERYKSYREYIALHVGKLSIALRVLVQQINLHDACFDEIVSIPRERQLIMKGIAFDWIADQYHRIVLHFHGVDNITQANFSCFLDEKIASVAREELEILGKNQFILRMVCEQGGARNQRLSIIEIPFTHFEMLLAVPPEKLNVHTIQKCNFHEVL